MFKSGNGVSYGAISSYMYKLSTHPRLDSGISFERYPAAKKCLGGIDVEVSVKDEIATFRGEIFCISTFTIGEPGEPYCTIPGECLKLLNKFLGTTINNLKIEFCKKDGPCGPGVVQQPHENLLFSVDKEYYQIDIRLSTKA